VGEKRRAGAGRLNVDSYVLPPLLPLPLPSVCPSAWNIRSTAKTVIELLWGAYRKSYPGCSGDPPPTPYDHPFSSKLGLATHSQFPAFSCVLSLWLAVRLVSRVFLSALQINTYIFYFQIARIDRHAGFLLLRTLDTQLKPSAYSPTSLNLHRKLRPNGTRSEHLRALSLAVYAMDCLCRNCFGYPYYFRNG